MSEYLTQLQVVKRGCMYVVQVRRQKFFTRRWCWVDMHKYLKHDKIVRKGPGGGYLPLPATQFRQLENAKNYCTEYLRKETTPKEDDVVVLSFNAFGLPDVFDFTPKMPSVKPPKEEDGHSAPLHRALRRAFGPNQT